MIMEMSTIHYNQVNEFMNGKIALLKDIKPGMAATMFCGTDRYAMVVTEVISPKTIKVAHLQNDFEADLITDENGIMWLPEILLDTYKSFVPDENGYCGFYVPITYTLRKNMRWMPKGQDMWGTSSVMIGKAENYRDPEF